jgi:enoyl-CoA hydratase/carnithine racemase
MTSKRPNQLVRTINAPKANRAMHEHYVRAVNAALESGRDDQAAELAAAYGDDLRQAA